MDELHDCPIWWNGKDIIEAAFCEEFMDDHRLKICAVKNVPHTISNIVELLKFYNTGIDLTPQQDRIHLDNGTLYLDGTFTEGKPEIVRSRLPVRYSPNAPQPEHWLRFLHDLLYEDDIPTV